SVPRLPVEVCGRIIDHIAMKWHDGNITGDPYLTTLTSCALVCQDWYFLTCYHLHQYIYLRDRKDVLSLSKSLQARPRFREIVQVVFISGASIRHLGTVAAMLAGKAPKLWRIGIKDAEWTIRSVRMEDISYLAASNSIEALDLSNVTLSSVAQLSRLVSALRRLRHIQCFRVDFL
ncbi:uncharacterized protein B0H18DRAFT_848692, partial [Fomitopsis serialis]|uniref:uncharacterized protein n=1 Tax=Fomitopsis serialis TaxID=139415 RepID=UPI0020089EBC